MLSSEVESMEWELRALKQANRLLAQELSKSGKDKPMVCSVCKFFVQHYILEGNYISQVNYGRCMAGRIHCLMKKAEGKTCKYFQYKYEE